MSCRRHVDVRAAACPFCGAAIAASPRSATLTFVGRVSRAAVFTGLAACWTTNPPDRPLPSMPQPPPQLPAATTVSLTGRVLAQNSGAPLANAVVELHNQGGRVGQTNTDADGRYRFDGIKPDDYQVVVRYSTMAQIGSAQQPVTVHDHGEYLELHVTLMERMNIPKPYGAPPARRRTV